MQLSSFFRDLRSSYQAEIDDMTFDSEGKDVLRQRLAQRRKEMDFLMHMMEASPEMVAVVFHQAFRFKRSSVMDHLLAQNSDDLPPWSAIEESIDVTPWAGDLVQLALQQPQGEWFMSIVAGLEYMFHKQDASTAASSHDSEDDEGDDDHDHQDGQGDGDDRADPMDSDDATGAKEREEAGADWMVEQGFDRKD